MCISFSVPSAKAFTAAARSVGCMLLYSGKKSFLRVKNVSAVLYFSFALRPIIRASVTLANSLSSASNSSRVCPWSWKYSSKSPASAGSDTRKTSIPALCSISRAAAASLLPACSFSSVSLFLSLSAMMQTASAFILCFNILAWPSFRLPADATILRPWACPAKASNSPSQR